MISDATPLGKAVPANGKLAFVLVVKFT